MSEDVLVNVENVSKKFCRTLKRSLWYGIQDVVSDVMGRTSREQQLRPNEFWAVNNLSFALKRSECLGLIGRNGAGKTTLLRMLNGLIKPDSGRIVMSGKVGAMIALGAGFNPILTGRENIYVNASVLGLSKYETSQKLNEIIEFSEIGEFIDSPVQNYSSGMAVRLGFSIAVHVKPDILLVDEVLAVGDIEFRMKCYKKILELRSQGTAIVLVSHNLLDISRVCDSVLVLDKGGMKVLTDDPNKGISIYQGLCRDFTPLKDGGGDVLIKDVQLIRDRECLATGDDVGFVVLIQNSGVMKTVRIVVHIQDPEYGVLGSFSSPLQGKYFNLKEKDNFIKFKLKKLNLLKGRYYMRISVYGESIDDFLCADDRFFFDVDAPETDFFGFGRCHAVNFEHEWCTDPSLDVQGPA
jgi:lipopolysaccharide transport system ATP-binding protein